MAYTKNEQQRINAGLCRNCGQPQSDTSKIYCHVCCGKMTTLARERRAKLRAAGLCSECGENPMGDYARCQDCLARARSNRTAWKKRVPYGVCTTCQKNKCLLSLKDAKLYMRHCQECYLKHAAAYQLGAVKYWRILLTKLEQQQWRCIYSGDTIVLGVNDSTDHIAPKSRRPDLAKDPSNIQWVTRTVNRLKDNLTHNEFLDLIHRIHDRFQFQDTYG